MVKNIDNNVPFLSIVVPAYNESDNLTILLKEINKVLTKDISREIIFVDDGSSDDTWDIICKLSFVDKDVRGISFSRNFGHQPALLAGLTKSKGEVVVMMDADLQHPPIVINELIKEWEKGYKIVHTIRLESEATSFFKRITSRFYYKFFSFLSGVNIEPGTADFRLLDREVVNQIIQLKESSLFFRGLVQWIGFPSIKVEFLCGERIGGISKYSIKKMVRLAMDGILAFSIVPLRVGILIGLITSSISFSMLGYALFLKLFTNETVQGWASAVSIISFLFGILFIFLGIIGEYLGQVLLETKERPKYFIFREI